jgi:hypothetical protein
VTPDWFDPLHTSPLPVREATSNGGVEFPWLVHSPSGSSDAADRYEELQPPPEYSEELSSDPEQIAQAAVSQLEMLTSRIDELRAQVEQLQASQSSVEESLQSLATASTDDAPREIVLLAWMLEVDRNGALSSGLVPAMLSSPEFASVAGVSRDEHVRFAWTDAEGTPFWSWLSRQAGVHEIACHTRRVAPRATVAIEISAPAASRIQEVRGTQISQPAAAPVWGGSLAVRASSTTPGMIEIEFQPAQGPASHWMHASVPEQGVLVMEGPSEAPWLGGDAPMPGRPARAAGRDLVVVVQPHVAGMPETLPTLPEHELLLTP